MNDQERDSSPLRGVSTVVGVTVLIGIVVVLASVLTLGMTGLAKSNQASAAVHGIGTFDIDFEEGGERDNLRIEPDALQSQDTTYILEINDKRVYEWNGHEPYTLTCLYPGDDIIIYSEKGATTNTVQKYEMSEALSCEKYGNNFEKRLEKVVIRDDDGLKEATVLDFSFSVSINPDGTGPDSLGGNSYTDRVGWIPATNQWNYIKKFDRSIGGLQPPVYLIIMTDNVHKKGNANGKNWTDDPNQNWGKNAYSLKSSGNTEKVDPIGSGTEPTNDVYMVFKPGCTESTLRVVDTSIGYKNDIAVNGQKVIDNAKKYNDDSKVPKELDVPSVDCR